MQRALTLAAAAVLGLAGVASAATTTVLDEGYSAFNRFGTWVLVSKDSTVAYTGSASMKIDTHGMLDATNAVENFIHARAALDTAIATDQVNPASASLSFAYNFTYDSGPSTRTLEVGLQNGDWGYLGGFFLSGTTELTVDGAWHTATLNFAGWTTTPSGPTQMDWVTIRNPANNWQGDESTLYMDNFVFTSPVPEPTSLAVLALGGLLALRRRA